MRLLVAGFTMVVAAASLAQLAGSVWPCAQGPNLDWNVPLELSKSIGLITTYNVCYGGDFLCDEEGNLFVGGYGLVKLSPTFDVVWTQPDASQPLVVQDDGSVIALGPNGSGLRLIGPDGTIRNSIDGPNYTSDLYGTKDGGLFVLGGARFRADLSVKYNTGYSPIFDRDGTAWVTAAEGDRPYVGTLNETGDPVLYLDLSGLGPGLFDAALVAVGPGPEFYVAEGSDGPAPGCLAKLSATGELLWVDSDHPLDITKSHFVRIAPTGDVFYVLTYPIDYFTTGHDLCRHSSDGSKVIYYSAKSVIQDDEINLGVDRTDNAGGVFLWRDEVIYGLGIQVYYYDSALADRGRNWVWNRGTGPGGPDYQWYLGGWGFHPDGYLVESEQEYYDSQELQYTNLWGPSSIIRSTADIGVRGGSANSLTYRFRLRKPGEDTMVKRRGHSTGPFTWEFHSASGTFEVLASADYTLWVKQPVTVGPSSVDVSFTLPVGDVTGDNVINLVDITAWFMNPVDLNNDGNVGLRDLSLILRNYGKVGDE